MPRTNRGRLINPDLPANEELLWMEIDNQSVFIDADDRSQYLTAADQTANDGSHSEEIPIVRTESQTVVGVIHMHWGPNRVLRFMHVKEDMLGQSRYRITFQHQDWSAIVNDLIQ